MDPRFAWGYSEPLLASRQALLTLLRRKRQLPSVQSQLQGRVLLSHKRLKIQGEGHDVLPDLKQKKALSAPHCHIRSLFLQHVRVKANRGQTKA